MKRMDGGRVDVASREEVAGVAESSTKWGSFDQESC